MSIVFLDAKNRPITPNEDSSCRLRFRATDFDGTPIPFASLLSATMTLKDKTTAETINGWNETNIMTNCESDGLFTIFLQPEDNVIVNPDAKSPTEIHIATIVVRANGTVGTIQNKEDALIEVKNLQFVTE